MVAIRATFDGEKIILPPGIRSTAPGPMSVLVTVHFPDGAIADAEHAADAALESYAGYTSIWDFVNDDYRPNVPLEERLRDLNDDRDAWVDPHEEQRTTR